jgi:hypothetical protein
MAELGYQEGRNFTFDYIQTPNVEGYEKNYLELAARKVDVFLAVGNEPALRAALSVADGKPIAFLAIDFDPLAKGYVAAISAARSERPSAQRCSIAIVRPSIQPSSRNRCTKAATHGPWDEGVPATRNPMVGSFPRCCARADSGHAAAPPSSVMKSRRPMQAVI